MIKRTLYFGSRTYLKTRNEQLIISFHPEANEVSIPIEDIGVFILDHNQITITQPLLNKLLENNVAVITCNASHHPIGLFFNLNGNSLQSQKFKIQTEVAIPLKKQLWQQTVIAKIQNQAALIEGEDVPNKHLLQLSKQVKSGDTTNCEAQAAVYYWKNVFSKHTFFSRDREGAPPNNLLNYGYAILRAVVARSLVASGLHPTLGIFHRNQYNAYCLADDIMEPYRPYVDQIVLDIVKKSDDWELTKQNKTELLKIPAIDVIIDNNKSPLMNAVQRTTASLIQCYEKKLRNLLYPTLILGD